VVAGFRRQYPHGATAAHAVGHLRLVSQDELEHRPRLDPTTLVGATGIEALFEPVLAGVPGERWVVVSAVGRQLGVVGETSPQAGSDLTVTLDIGLQEAARAALGDHAGAIVALDAGSGAVRAMYSAPSFDPNRFAGRLSRDEWEALTQDPRHPLQNRCLQGAYPPGSTIKPFLALAGLDTGAISPTWGTYCSGSVVLYGHRFRCWQRGGHGHVRLERSLEVSCDSYYYLLGQRLGIDALAEWLRRFGFGHTTGVGIGTENRGLVGTPEWSERVRGTPWYPGDLVSMSIGQGPVLATVAQLARAYAALANGGRLVTLHLVEDAAGAPADGLPLEGLAPVVRGLERAVAGREGTARVLGQLPVAGKTGTAQVVRLQEGVELEEMERRFRHHAWFVGWAPRADPRLVVAVLVEHGGGGGSVAAPIAGSVLRAFLERDGAAEHAP
jgi:penicillin-binding protein 2